MNRTTLLLVVCSIAFLTIFSSDVCIAAATDKPHMIFVMANDMGWGPTGYRNYPVLKKSLVTEWRQRWEYQSYLNRDDSQPKSANKKKQGKGK